MVMLVRQQQHHCRLPRSQWPTSACTYGWLLKPRACRRKRRLHVTVKAEFGGVVDSVVTYGAVTISLGATAYAIFTNWPRHNDKPAALSHPDDNFTWGLMGFVSFVPLFNFMAWVLAALQSDNPRPYYWAALLYGLPLLRNGFDQDWFSITLLLIGAAHIQALRIAATEPHLQAKLQQQLRPLSVLAAVAQSTSKIAGAVIGTQAQQSQQQGQQQQPNQQQLGPGSHSNLISNKFSSEHKDTEELVRQMELEEFDRRLQDKAKRRKE